MMKPGKLSMIVVCAAMLALLVACAADQDPAPAESNPTTSEMAQLPLPSPEEDSLKSSDEPVEEPVEEQNPIPFFVPDLDPDDPDVVWAPAPGRVLVPISYIETEHGAPAISQKISDPDKFEDGTPYFGRWIIQAREIDVACYLSWSQSVVDAEDAAALFQLGDQYVIADHSNQDFKSLSACKPGDLACLEREDGIAVYVCTAIVQGHNIEETITDDAGTPIEYGFNTGGITCYTCNGNWKNIHIVLFSPVA